ncbi:MAG: TROVE domain-containing protein [Ruminococcus sp.]|nr:TROVE domain-containing protein [Ruminococcus sp.]
MAKFNQKNTNKTINRDGWVAYKMEDKEHLVTAVLTSMFGEPKYYGSTDNDIVKLSTTIAQGDPEFLTKLACYARNVGNMRSVSHVLACVIAHEASKYTRAVIRNIIVRPDDITEIMACYLSLYGKPFPNALKREIAVQIQQFDEYKLAKYNGRHQSMKFRDVLRITHPVPKDKETEALFRKVLDDTLETPYTWETELSEKGNTKEVWDELIASGKVGYMALLRNLRNIIQSGADVTPVLKTLSDPDRVRKSRQLPFRFFSAYRMLEREGLMTPAIHRALESALTVSVENMETIPGRTLIAIDVSGSMGYYISKKSTVMCSEVASLLGAIASRICEDATVCYFDCEMTWSCLPEKKGYLIKHYGKYDSILEICRQTSFSGGGTQMDLPMKFALEEDNTARIKPFDRVIYFSDNVCNSSSYGLMRTVQSAVDKYRNTYNPNFWVHGVDMQGYGTQQFCGKNFNLIAGWSETVLPFINLAEKGIGSLVRTIEEYEVK